MYHELRIPESVNRWPKKGSHGESKGRQCFVIAHWYQNPRRLVHDGARLVWGRRPALFQSRNPKGTTWSLTGSEEMLRDCRPKFEANNGHNSWPSEKVGTNDQIVENLELCRRVEQEDFERSRKVRRPTTVLLKLQWIGESYHQSRNTFKRKQFWVVVSSVRLHQHLFE